jgi:hypothetical protein
MKSLFTFALGLIIARQVYINFDKVEAREKEARVKGKLQGLLKDIGLTSAEAKAESEEILGT